MIKKYRYPGLMSTSRLQGTVSRQEPIICQEERSAPEIPHGTYGALLFDERWKSRRGEILFRDGRSCVICKGKEDLQVHHRQYHFIKSASKFKPPWDYADHLLLTLCKSCHNRGHSKFKVPTIAI